MPYLTFRDTLSTALRSPRAFLQGKSHESSPLLWALDDVSFDINQGEVVGIVGRNGAGKSHPLAEDPLSNHRTDGRLVELFGRVGSLLEVGIGFHPELTGRENILLNGGILGMSNRKRFDALTRSWPSRELERLLDTPVKHYTSGMYVRLAFAVAAHLDPEILIVDEVLAVGDAEFQSKCLGKMSDISKTGRTILFVSHNLQAIQSLSADVLSSNRWRPNRLPRDSLKGSGTVLEFIGRAEFGSRLVRGGGTRQRGGPFAGPSSRHDGRRVSQ